MLEGMIIGAIVGLIAAALGLIRQKKLRKGILMALEAGNPRVARQELDRRHPPATKLSLGDIVNQRERMAGLALLNDPQSILREMSVHQGALAAVVQVGALGCLGLAHTLARQGLFDGTVAANLFERIHRHDGWNACPPLFCPFNACLDDIRCDQGADAVMNEDNSFANRNFLDPVAH